MLGTSLVPNSHETSWFMKPTHPPVGDSRSKVNLFFYVTNVNSRQFQVCPIRTLSDGQRCRIIFAWLAQKAPHLLLLDEPTNHLDIETIDSLADAIDDFEGGLLLVSHDFRLISQVAKEIWVCENETVTPWEGDIFSYKKYLMQNVLNEA
ncbi:unnamed protein product [Trichobilharzia regenti]|nr:unnamed protein product [Trichobilharzia regenti]